MDLILQKATELGVARIAPVVTERTEVTLDAERADKRARTGAACSPRPASRAARAPAELLPPRSLGDFLAASAARRLVLDPGAGDAGAACSSRPAHRSACWSGPKAACRNATSPRPRRRLHGLRWAAHPAHGNRRAGRDRRLERAVRRLALNGRLRRALLTALSISSSRLSRSGTAAGSPLSVTIE
jgi:hypothetical protein